MWKILLVVGVRLWFDGPVSQCKEAEFTPPYLINVEQLKNVAAFDDAQHRGPKWYEDTSSADSSISDLKSANTDTTSNEESSEEYSETGSSAASSIETAERRRATKVYRTCTPCPHDMLKNFKNRGIKWICARYQRARRSFKSECMMRYRNCQDGTLFIKIHDNRCQNNTYHGRHWFYDYKAR